jgi:hypothetical protein
VIVGLCVAVLLLVKVSYHAQHEFARGQTAEARGEIQQAIVHYERAIKWYTPLSKVVGLAVERLWALGATAEQQAEFALALEAYEALRASLYATQSFYVPYKDWIVRSEEKIALLMARRAPATQHAPERLPHEVARFTAMLQRDTAPHPGWTMLIELGFFGWVGCTILLIWHATSLQGVWVWQHGIGWGSGIVICFAIWLIGMWLA